MGILYTGIYMYSWDVYDVRNWKLRAPPIAHVVARRARTARETSVTREAF